MAFWGIEVKPGKPVTHTFDQARGRLRISQATLGIGSSATKSLVQCNIGDKSPVLLCALLPDKTESCHLDLEFEEADDVVFSVIGPRSAYLTGYYLSGRYPNHNDSSESYGEDIGNSDEEESFHGSEEDNYEDSFIDDGDPEIFPPSPISSDTACVEEMLDKKKSKEKKARCKRLKKRCQSIDDDDNSDMHQQKGASPLRIDDEDKKARHKLPKKRYQLIESDDDDNSHMQDHKDASSLKSDDEDKLPISTLVKSRKTEAEEIMEAEKGRNVDEKIANDRPNAQTPNDGVNSLKFDDNVSIIEDSIKFGAVVADRKPERGSDSPSHGLLLSDGRVFDLTKSKKKRKRSTKETPKAKAKAPADGREGDWSCDALLPSTIPDLGNGIKPKRRREQFDDEGEDLVRGAKIGSVLTEEKAKQNVGGFQKSSEDMNSDIAHNSVVKEDKSEDKKSKRKKKSKPHRKEDNVGDDFHLLSKEEKNKPDNGYNGNGELKLPQARTLSNGLIIQELEDGKPDGKMATSGKKVKVHYVGKLRECGKIFDSSIGKAPSKFRLGAEGVIEGWNLGLEGMRVGGKRRLTIPPNIGYGSEGAGENIPPNSWLVYEVELVGVR